MVASLLWKIALPSGTFKTSPQRGAFRSAPGQGSLRPVSIVHAILSNKNLPLWKQFLKGRNYTNPCFLRLQVFIKILLSENGHGGISSHILSIRQLRNMKQDHSELDSSKHRLGKDSSPHCQHLPSAFWGGESQTLRLPGIGSSKFMGVVCLLVCLLICLVFSRQGLTV